MLPAESTLERESMSDRIRNAILRRIADGTYQPGHRLVELQLAKEFGTSQGPVREALRELETLQVVETKRYCGSSVREVPLKERQEAYEVRAVLEQYAAQLAAPYLKGNVEELHRLATEIMAAAEKGDVPEYAAKDLPFHRTIVEQSRNSVLLRNWEQLGFELQTRIHLSRNSEHLVANATAHFAIVNALNRGDGHAAGRLLRDHAMSFVNDD
jgi:DNA-binding GntR family transcriptional regulator